MAAAIYRKKPIEIEAIQFTGGNRVQVGHFAGLSLREAGRESRLEIVTREGVMIVSVGDWVIKGINGEFYPCKPDIFEKTYDFVRA